MTSLRDKTISGMFWAFLQKIGSRGISFVVMILLARLLTPRDFGLIGMLMIFIQISQAIVDGGFNMALIQKKDTDEEDYSSVFYINLVVSFALYLILFFTAPLIADFYHQPLLTSLARVLALVFIINAFSFVQEARLTKEIKFKMLMIIHIPSTIFGGVASIVMAMLGFGVWSIVAMQLVTRFAYSVQIWIRSKWKPLLSFNKLKAKSLFSFGGRIMLTSIITSIYNNIFIIIIGKFYPVKSVGYYQNAFNMATIPSNTATTVLSGVSFSAFSSIQEDNERLKAAYKRLMQQAFFWICPAYVLVGVLATPLFEVVFTEKWLPAVPYFQWLCIVGIFHPLKTYNLNIVNVKGRSDIFLKLQIVWRALITIGIFATVSYGVTALLIVQASSYVFAFLLFGYYAGKFIEYHLFEQIRDILPIFSLSLGIGIGVYCFEQLIVNLPNSLQLIGGFGVGGGLYWLLAMQFKFPPYLEFKDIFQNKISRLFLTRR